MKLRFAVLAIAIPCSAAAAKKPRVFMTESHSVQLSGDGALALVGGTSPQNVEVMKSFIQRCPEVIVTSNRAKADYIVRLDHEEPSPLTPFVRGNKVAISTRIKT